MLLVSDQQQNFTSSVQPLETAETENSKAAARLFSGLLFLTIVYFKLTQEKSKIFPSYMYQVFQSYV